MATLEARLIALAQAIGTDIKTGVTERGSLASLSTSAKTSLVAAINEVVGSIGSLASLNTTAKSSVVAAINEVLAAIGGAGATIDDNATDGNTGVTWSANKIFDEIAAAKVAVKNDLVNGAAAALDTLAELAAALGGDANYSATVATALGNRVRFDAAQTLSAGQKTQACTNIGIGEPDTDLVSAYNTAKA